MLFDWLFGGRESRDGGGSLENPDVAWNDPDAWEAAFGWGATGTGESVGPAKALTLSPVWKAVKMISGDVAKLPLEVFARGDTDGSRTKDTSHPAFDLICGYGRANAETTALQFWRTFVAAMLLWENGYAWIDRDSTGRPLGLYYLLPDRTTTVRKAGRKYVVTEVAGKLEALEYADCLHVPGLSLDGVNGCELVRMAREDMAQAIAARNFTSKFFKNGLHAGGVLQVPPGATPKAKRKVERAIEEKTGGDKAFKTLILRDGFKWFQTMVDPSRAALIEATEQKTRDVANFFLLWPGHLGVRDSISYNSIEQQRRDYYDTTLSYHLTGIRAECNAKLLTDDERRTRRRYVDYNVNALLWADAATVSTIGFGGVNAGVLTPDEVRGWWNLDPLPNGVGATTRVPLNTAPAPSGNTDAGDDDAGGASGSRAVNVAELRWAVRQIVADAATRCVTRWAIHHRRAVAKGTGGDWLARELTTHEDVCRAILAPAEHALRALGDTSADLLPALQTLFRARADRESVDDESSAALVNAFLEGINL